MRCRAPGQCSVTASDEGFGELYASSGKTWSVDIDMTAQPDENEQPAGDIAIECMKTAENAVFAMPVSGIRLHTPEELCWYIYHNTFAITPDIIGDDFYDWLDKITGSQEMTNAIRAYRQADRPFEDIIRLILRSVDYLTAAEIAEKAKRQREGYLADITKAGAEFAENRALSPETMERISRPILSPKGFETITLAHWEMKSK